MGGVGRALRAVATGGYSEYRRHQKKKAERAAAEAERKFTAMRNNSEQAINKISKRNLADQSGLQDGGGDPHIEDSLAGLGGIDPNELKLGKRKLLGG